MTLATSMLVLPMVGQTPMKEFCKELKSEMVISDPSYEWIQFGPGMSGNSKNAVWHPTDPNLLFISPNMGNSYRSTDGGVTYKTILNCDEAGMATGRRGPRTFTDIKFSMQDENFGFMMDGRPFGLYKTTDKGVSWENFQPSREAFANTYISALAVDPTDDNIWYVGSGRLRAYGRMEFTQAQPHGSQAMKNGQGKIWKSTDKGETWTLINKGLNPKAEVETILIDPTNSNVLYASTNYGFYRSKDGGESWDLKIKGLDSDVLRSFTYNYDKNTDKLSMYVIAAITWKPDGKSVTDDKGGIYRSDDRGESWYKINGDIALDMRQFKDNATVRRSYIHPVAYYFGMTDAEAWERFPEMPSKITQRFNQIAVDPSNADNIYLINTFSNLSRNSFLPGMMWRTKDGGKHWYISMRQGKNWDNGADDAYWKSRNNPVGSNLKYVYNFDWRENDIYITKAANMLAFNSDGSILHTQIAKMPMFSYDKGETWVDLDDVELSREKRIYVGGGNSNMPGHGFYQDLRFKTVFCMAGENGLWTTVEGGEKVRPNAQATALHKVLEYEMSPSSIAIDPKNPDLRYALFFRLTARGEFVRSTDGGKNWEIISRCVPEWEVKERQGDQPTHQLNLTIDPKNSNNLFFCVAKQSGSYYNYVGNSESGFGVNRSQDGGLTWSPCNNGLPEDKENPYNIPVITYDPNDDNKLYACYEGKNKGLFCTTNGGDSWERVMTTPKQVLENGANDLHFAQDGKIYITSGSPKTDVDGGGAWVSSDNMKSWKQIFDFPATFRIETARYNPKVILLSTLSNRNIGLINPGTYLSKDGGESWVKINKVNGQSDQVNDIAIDNYVPGKYYVSTFGAVWYYMQYV